MKKAMGLILAVLLVMGSLRAVRAAAEAPRETGKPRP